MNFVLICLHSLDMRDFHSHMRDTPFLDGLRSRSIYIPMGRGQGHNQHDSLNAELTGIWTARFCNSQLTHEGYVSAKEFWFPKTIVEYLEDKDYDIYTCMTTGTENMGSAAVSVGMKDCWLNDEPERLRQFSPPKRMTRSEALDNIKRSKKFYAHFILRETHRPWAQNEGLAAIVGKPPGVWPHDAFCARKAALDRPDEFAALRRRGLGKADNIVKYIFEETKELKNVTYLVYSNHGEVFDHFRYILPYKNDGALMIRGTSHGPYPYEVLYANMQMWIVPNLTPRTMTGIGRSIDIPPTILELAEIDPGIPMDGESMVKHFKKGTFSGRDRYAESGKGGALSMVRHDGFKLVSTGLTSAAAKDGEFYGPDYHRLAVFDLQSDPYEYVNLINTDKGQEVLEWAVTTHKELKKNQRLYKYSLR